MSNRPIPVKCWEKFLKYKGCFKKRISSSHHNWECPDCSRNIIHWGNKKEVPAFHIKSNLETMGVDKKEFFNWVAKNC